LGYSQIWLNFRLGNCHFGYITKLRKKTLLHEAGDRLLLEIGVHISYLIPSNCTHVKGVFIGYSCPILFLWILWCSQSSNCPYKYLAKSGYKSDVKYKKLIYLSYFWLITQTNYKNLAISLLFFLGLTVIQTPKNPSIFIFFIFNFSFWRNFTNKTKASPHDGNSTNSFQELGRGSWGGVGYVVRPSRLGMAPLLRVIPGIKDLAKISNMGNKRRSLGIMALPRALTGIKT